MLKIIFGTLAIIVTGVLLITLLFVIIDKFGGIKND